MHNYDSLRQNFSNKVSQTIDSPIMIFDYFELSDAFVALGVILLFGVLFYEWGLMFALLTLVLGAGPAIKKRNEKGVFLHWPYKYINMSLPGLVNPRRSLEGMWRALRRYSD